MSKSFIHNDEEIVHPNATLIKNKCIYCGKENFSWFDREPFTYNLHIIRGNNYEKL